MSKLRLGPILQDKPVKLTVELSGALHRMLSEYARAHADAHGLDQPLAPERLIAPIVETFMAGDRGFAHRRRKDVLS